MTLPELIEEKKQELTDIEMNANRKVADIEAQIESLANQGRALADQRTEVISLAQRQGFIIQGYIAGLEEAYKLLLEEDEIKEDSSE